MKTKISFIVFFLIKVVGIAQPCKTVIGYYPGWQWYDRSNLVNPASINYDSYSIINYAFLAPQTDGSIGILDPWADKNLLLGTINWQVAPVGYDVAYDLGNAAYHNPNTSLISEAHEHNVKVMISIGGWSLSDLFPSISADVVKRTNFAHWCCNIIRTYSCDGIDIDWEYPGYADHNGTPEDAANFTLLLSEVRDSLDALNNGDELLLTAAVGASLTHMQNVHWSDVEPLLDYINLMSYDYFTAGDALTNHNSPLFPAQMGNPDFNLSASVTNLTSLYEVPSEKINAGIAFYGRSAVTTGPPALHTSSAGYSDAVTFAADEGTPLYYNILQQIGEFEAHWDGYSHVPYLTGLNGLNTFVSYDNEESIAEKADFVVDNNLAGVIIWEITGDYIETVPGSGVIASTPLADAMNGALCSLPSVPLDCENICVLEIALNEVDGWLDVTIENGGDVHINYPTVIVILNGDTVANIDETFDFFAHLSDQTLTYTIPTTLTELPQNFTCQVEISDPLYNESCMLNYPCLPIGIDENELVNFTLYPNPAGDVILMDQSLSVDHLEIFDSKGSLVKAESRKGWMNQLQIGDLESGIYQLRFILSDGRAITRKFVKHG